MYPEDLSVFQRKVDALYEGDPNGDYVLAEDVNELQEAIEQIEATIGLNPEGGDSVYQRIKRLERLTQLRVPTGVAIDGDGLGLGVNTSIHEYRRFQFIALRSIGSESNQLVRALELFGTQVYGTVDARDPLEMIQTRIGEWRALGATGVRVTYFGPDELTRLQENDIIRSIEEAGMKTWITGTRLAEVFSERTVTGYNPSGTKTRIHPNTIVEVGEIGHYGGHVVTPNTVQAQTTNWYPIRESYNIQLLGCSMSTSQKQYGFTQASALVFSYDFILESGTNGITNASTPSAFSWNIGTGEWREMTPSIRFLVDGAERTIFGGKIRVLLDGNYRIEGMSLDSSMLQWNDDSLEGTVVREGTLPANRIKEYDVDRIIDTINQQANVKIDLSKIDAEDLALPASIGSSNMRENVIKAINEKKGILGATEFIDQAAIDSINAEKVIGDITALAMKKHVVDAVNVSLTPIDVSRATIDSLTMTELQGDILTIKTGTMNDLNVINSINTGDVIASGTVNAKYGVFESLKTIQLEADVLRVDDLLVEDLISNKIAAETLTVVTANIETGIFNTIVTKSLESDVIKTDVIMAINSMTDKAYIDGAVIQQGTIIDAQIKSLSAGKITAGSINTGLVNLTGIGGLLRIDNNRLEVYDAVDSAQVRHKRVQLGDLGNITPGAYGLVVFGEDGSTRLYDHTGVYNAGIRPNAVSESKLAEGAVSERVIVAGAITADKLAVDSVVAGKIAANSITSRELTVGSITAGKAVIAEGAIFDAMITNLHGSKITANSITASSIKANTITTDRLSFATGHNMVSLGFDSFEQIAVGTMIGTVLQGAETHQVMEESAWVGTRSLKVMGNSFPNRLLLARFDEDYHIPVLATKKYYVTAYARTNSQTGINVQIGLKHSQGIQLSEDVLIKGVDSMVRIVAELTMPVGVSGGAVVLVTKGTNIPVWFDGVQVEEAGTALEPGAWKPSTTTVIDADSITTGTVKAEHIDLRGLSVRNDNGDVTFGVDQNGNVQINIGEYTNAEIRKMLQDTIDINLAMRVGYKAFQTIEDKHVYFHGRTMDQTTKQWVSADIDGHLTRLDNQNQVVLKRGALRLINVFNKKGFIVYTLSDEKYRFIWQDKDTEKWYEQNEYLVSNGYEYTFPADAYAIGELEI